MKDRETLPKKFFVIGGYTYANPGDEAILKGTLARLNSLRPGSHFVIWIDKKDFSVRLDPDFSHEFFFHANPCFFSSNSFFCGLLSGWYRRAFPLSAALVRLLSFNASHAVKKMKECDYVIFIGGGYLNSLYNLLQMHHLYRLARECGRPIYLLGQTIGPFFRSQDRAIAEDICRGAKSVVVREESSKAELPRVAEKIQISGDDALNLWQHLREEDKQVRDPGVQRAESQLLLGLNLKSSPGVRNFYPELVRQLNRFSREEAGGRLKVIFIPMEASVYCDDREEAELLKKMSGRDFEFSVLSEPLTVENRLAAISKTDLFLGMRFHSLVFAVSSAVPCIGLYADDYYQRKLFGLFETYGIQQNCVHTDEIATLAGRLSRLYRDRPRVRDHLRQKHSEMLKCQNDVFRSLFAR